MARNITDQDILEALNGKPAGSAHRSNGAVSDALNGRPSAAEQTAHEAVARAFGREPKRAAKEGELPLKRRGDALEGVAIWAAKEASATATKALAETIMRSDGTKGIHHAEAEANEIAAEAYAEAAKSSPYEDRRQESVARVVTKLAEQITRTREATTKPALQPKQATEAKPQTAPLRGTKKISHGAISGSRIEYYH
jgi:hypothetical protein